MSDKVVGIIGQMYEDRKTGKKGRLDSRNEKYKTLMLVGEDGKSFSISNSTFRSNWRKFHEETEQTVETQTAEEPATAETNETETTESENVAETVEEEAETETPKPEKKTKKKQKKAEPVEEKKLGKHDYSDLSEDEAVLKFKEKLQNQRTADVIKVDNVYLVKVEGLDVIRFSPAQEGEYHLRMFPDVFSETGWYGTVETSSIHYELGREDHMSVELIAKTSIQDLLAIIEGAVADINLYGYQTDEEENTNEAE